MTSEWMINRLRSPLRRRPPRHTTSNLLGAGPYLREAVAADSAFRTTRRGPPAAIETLHLDTIYQTIVSIDTYRSRPSIFRRIILVGTAPRGGEDVMHLEKPSLARYLAGSNASRICALTENVLCTHGLETSAEVQSAASSAVKWRISPFYWANGWWRAWDSYHYRLLKTKNLRHSRFLTIRQIRTKALVGTRIEHGELRDALHDGVYSRLFRTSIWSFANRTRLRS